MCLRLCVAMMAMFIATLTASADTFELQFSGSGETGSVLLTANTTATTGEFLITAASGSIDTQSVSLLPANTFPSVGPNDNLLFFSASAGQNNFDTEGISFLLASGIDYNLYELAGQYFAEIGTLPSVVDIDTLTVTRASALTPEPASFLLLGAGLLVVTCAVRRRAGSLSGL